MKKILIIQKKMIGDVLLSTIIIEFLKQKHKKCQVDYLIDSNTKAVVEGNPYVDNVIEISPQLIGNKLKYLGLLLRLRKLNYNLVIDVYGTLSSNIISVFTGAKERVSWHKKYSHFYYTKTIKENSIIYTNAGKALEDRLRLIVEENEIAKNIIRPKIYLTCNEKLRAKKIIEQQNVNPLKKIVMVSVLGSSVDKTLPLAYMAKIIDKIVDEIDAVILFNYLPDQKSEANTIFSLTKVNTKKNIYMDIFGKSLREFLALLANCDMLVGNEGGAVNMAKALNIPTFTIFSPWIKKESWNMFDDNKKYTSIHLKDFKPELYKNIVYYKELKPNYEELYNLFTPDFIVPELSKYLQNFK